MRPLLLLFTLFALPAAAAPALELEVNGGVKGSDCACAFGPTLGARIGLDIANLFTVSVKGMSLSKFDQPRQEFGLLLDARFHSRGRLEFNGGLGLGLAIATVDQNDASIVAVRPFPLLDIGLRLNLWRFFIGLNVGGWPFAPTWFGALSVGVSLFGD